MSDAAGDIREARNLLFERGWHQGSMRGKDGSLCILGALGKGTDMGFASLTHTRVYSVVANLIPYSVPVCQWNDHPARTFDDIIDMLDRAEKKAEELDHG